MPVQPYTSCALLGFGLAARKVTVINVPYGSTVVRIRSRSDDFIRVYLRTLDGFEEWFADFADTERRTLKLTSLSGQNIRPLASRPAPLAFPR
jgi:hypothetical protein